jgi:putative peptidoglycan binding protein
VTSLTGEEPDLELGASGEGVILLQVRLYQLGIYRQVPDGTYDSVTENAVRELQSQLGLDNDGEVHRETWEAVVHQEQQAGIIYQYQSPYDALAQIRYALDHPAEGGGLLSEDGQWRWDGTDWQPAGASAGAAGDATAQAGSGEISPDGQWRWDGTDWQPAGDTNGGTGAQGGLLSDDGQWRWDGSDWRPA